MTDSAVDANCICYYQQERLLEQTGGRFHQAVDRLLAEGKLLLDVAGLCRQEWLDTACGPAKINLGDWISDLIASNKLAMVDTRPIGAHRRRLRELGVPSKDHKWFGLCRDGGAATFLTEDIDFFNPHEKRSGEARRRRVMDRGPAPVKRYFREEIGTHVVCCATLIEAD